VCTVQAAATAELPEFEPLRRRLLILRRHVVAAFAFGALKHNVIARHNSPLSTQTKFPTRPMAGQNR
jgi:hypothetical protein